MPLLFGGGAHWNTLIFPTMISNISMNSVGRSCSSIYLVTRVLWVLSFKSRDMIFSSLIVVWRCSKSMSRRWNFRIWNGICMNMCFWTQPGLFLLILTMLLMVHIDRSNMNICCNYPTHVLDNTMAISNNAVNLHLGTSMHETSTKHIMVMWRRPSSAKWKSVC